jgi:hypothetical protein
MVPQAFTVSKQDIYLPSYIDYEAPEYEFTEYNLPYRAEVKPTYYKPGKRIGEKSFGYKPQPDWIVEEIPDLYYQPPYYKHPDTRDLMPLYVDQTYTESLMAETQLSPPSFSEIEYEQDLIPRFEDNDWSAPKYRLPEHKEPKYARNYEASRRPSRTKVHPTSR